MWVQDQVKKLKEIRKVLLSLTRKNHRQRISVTSVRCVWVFEPTSMGLSVTHIIEIAMALVSIAVLLLELFTAAKSAKLMSPGAQFNHQIQIRSFCPSGQRGSTLSPFPEEQSHRQFEVWCSVLIYVSWLRKMDWPKNTCLIQLTMPTCIWKKWQSWWPPSPFIKGKKKVLLLCVGQPKTISAIILSWLFMSKGNPRSKRKPAGQLHFEPSWNLNSTVTLHLRPLTSSEARCPLLLEEVTYAHPRPWVTADIPFCLWTK